jgi:transaldolase
MRKLEDLSIKIYADGGDRAGVLDACSRPYVRGLTTNPSLMRRAGIADYEAFAKEAIPLAGDRPFSFEVLSDDLAEMRRQALKISSWGKTVYVKIPITNTRGESACGVIRELTAEGVQVNVTAMLSLSQLHRVLPSMNPSVPCILSLFAGRIADTGVDPMPVMKAALHEISFLPKAELLWASVREVYNILQAEASGCHIVTVTHDILARAERCLDMDHELLSLDTVKMFASDAAKAGYTL